MENENHSENTRGERPNKTKLKREIVALREQAALLPKLKTKKLEEMELGTELISAIDEYSRIKKPNAQKRHIQYITRLLSEQKNLDGILDTLHTFQNPHLKQQQIEKQVAIWVNLLLSDDHQKVEDFLAQYSQIDRQQFLHLLRNTKKEISKAMEERKTQDEDNPTKEGKQQKKLKKLLRSIFNSEN
jgi:ribosome-associated protein